MLNKQSKCLLFVNEKSPGFKPEPMILLPKISKTQENSSGLDIMNGDQTFGGQFPYERSFYCPFYVELCKLKLCGRYCMLCKEKVIPKVMILTH